MSSVIKYAEQGEVFIYAYDFDEAIPNWRRKPIAELAEGDRVIRCAWCSNAACRLDPHWPWMRGLNACQVHLEKGDADA